MAFNYLLDIDTTDGGDTISSGFEKADANFESIDNEIYTARGGEDDLNAKLTAAAATAAALVTAVTNGTTPFTTTYIRAYVNEQTPSAGVITKLTFSGETYDGLGEFATSKFTVTIEDYYDISARINFTSPTDQEMIYVYIYKNGEAISFAPYTANGTTAQSFPILDTLYLEVADYIEIYIYTGSGSTITGGSGNTILTIKRA